MSNMSSAKGTILYYLVLSLFFYLSIITLEAYDPVDHFSINCGSSGNSTDNDRTWTGDINSKLLVSVHDNQTIAAEATTQDSSVSQVPFTTARLSYSEFIYSFPVTQGQKFVRLFFYPSSYSGFNRPDALFTVKSSGFTLLKDFNASLTGNAYHADTIFREYIINVEDGQWINLTFTPSSLIPNCYAFINGIEILSMPNELYYTSANDQGVRLLMGSSNTPYNVGNKTALETSYRIIVGARTITAKNDDTGLLRNWEGNDDDYLRTPSARENALNIDVWGNMSITVNPDFVAPQEVYRSSRSMGTNATLNMMVNLTWEFPVDSGFFYMVRLHFCEIDPNVTDSNNRVFNIYIAGQLAEERANVLKWSKEKGFAVHRDYVVLIQGSHKRRENLTLQMHPLLDSHFQDAFLNGLEIFKINDRSTYSLAGSNPDPVPAPTNQTNQKKNSTSIATIIGVVLGAVSGVVLLSLIIFLFIQNKRKKNVKDSKSDGASKRGPLSFSTNKSTTTRNSSLPSDLCRQFSLAEIRAATSNFDGVFVVGTGGFGHVYKGYIDGGSTPVAIKRLKPDSQQGAREFMTEIHMLSQLRHLHLVSLIGYCNENGEMILVYDFMTRGTLRDHLYNTDNPPIPWKQRLQICIGAARGLHYLHTGAKHAIIHRDVKTTNILLDEKWVAKVSDFGLSRIGPTGISKAHVSTVVKGSIGYLDPEYYKRQRLTEKSDVYSFGVVLFEILCGRPPLIRNAEKKQVSLADWAKICWNSGTLGQIVDPTLKGTIAPECLRKFGEIGVSCLLDNGTKRPSMNDVVWVLEFALQLQENAEQREHDGGIGVVDDGIEKREFSDDMFSSGTSVGQVSDFNKSSGVSLSSSVDNSYINRKSDRLMPGAVFSEIMDPKAR